MQRTLRYAIAALCLIPLFFIKFEITASPFFAEVLDAGHIVVFFIFGWLAFPKISGGTKRRILILVLITLIASFLVEITQEWVGRAFQFQDIVRNYLGLGLSIALRLYFLTSKKAIKLYASLALFVFVGLLGFERSTLINLTLGKAYFYFNMPTLADFTYPFEAANWEGNYADIEYTEGGLLVKTESSRAFSGAFFRDFPSDWRQYQKLHLVIKNMQAKPLAITLKITDLQHEIGLKHYDERYNGEFTLLPGMNQFVIELSTIQTAPKLRNLDMEKVQRVELFLSHVSNGDRFMIKALHLSPIKG